MSSPMPNMEPAPQYLSLTESEVDDAVQLANSDATNIGPVANEILRLMRAHLDHLKAYAATKALSTDIILLNTRSPIEHRVRVLLAEFFVTEAVKRNLIPPKKPRRQSRPKRR